MCAYVSRHCEKRELCSPFAPHPPTNPQVAITTTDLVSKSAALEVELSPGRTVRLGGIAKGSGMIHPNM